ncbi:conserved hypothetical protein [Pediculus humanus corporis]|uniref:Sensory neuron membrane protein 2 n=1 Tax=Pediculus humanus subsp. corporis TaxID=121224 RepID=E0W0U3_PEDHC|nr:uncharacterized protein Phum_PHUM563950 [Pediculus humanus corporis]EEB19249.1 conserved hypothetical protein [Pediculus humanus corporis]
MADPSYQVIEGLKPEKEKHELYLHLEPYTGYPLSAASRIQINTYLKSIDEVKIMKKFPNVLLPVVWAEEKVELTDDLINKINSELLDNMLIVDVVRWLIVGLGIVMVLTSVSYYLAKFRGGQDLN